MGQAVGERRLTGVCVVGGMAQVVLRQLQDEEGKKEEQADS